MSKAHVHGPTGQHVGDVSICIKRDTDGDLSWDFFPDTTDPVGTTVALFELFCCVFPKQPNFLLHVAHACNSKEHTHEVLSQLSDDARLFLAQLIENHEQEGEWV